MTTKKTPGPWYKSRAENGLSVICHRNSDGDERVIARLISRQEIGDEVADADLISAAPELLEALKKRTENEEQRVFEDWLDSKRPSGDADEVNRQWLASSDYADFCDEWSVELDSISKATGEAQ